MLLTRAFVAARPKRSRRSRSREVSHRPTSGTKSRSPPTVSGSPLQRTPVSRLWPPARGRVAAALCVHARRIVGGADGPHQPSEPPKGLLMGLHGSRKKVKHV